MMCVVIISKAMCVLQERQKSNLLLDSILLREMAEELRRDRRQQTAQSEAAPPPGNAQIVEDKEHSIPFQDVLKYVLIYADWNSIEFPSIKLEDFKISLRT